MTDKKEKLEEIDPLTVELHSNLSRLKVVSQTEISKIDNNADFLKVEFLMKINNSLEHLIRESQGIRKYLLRIANILSIMSQETEE